MNTALLCYSYIVKTNCWEIYICIECNVLTDLNVVNLQKGHTELSIMHYIVNENPLIAFGITVCFSIVIFFIIRLSLCLLYKKTLAKWSAFQRYVVKLRNKGLPYYTKYGLIGLIVFVAIPIPGTGVYGATILSWLLNIKWSLSLLAILPGTIISNGIIVLTAFSIVRGIS